MKKSATHIWRSVRVNVGLPDGPPGLSEPQYAKVMFDMHCDVCCLPACHDAEWSLTFFLIVLPQSSHQEHHVVELHSSLQALCER